MKSTLRITLLSACLAIRLAAADDPTPTSAPAPVVTTPQDDQKKLEEAIRLRLAEHALKKEQAAKTEVVTPAATPATSPTPPEQPVTLLPRVEVSKSRVTELAIQEHQKDREIAQEKKNITPTPLDDTINGPGVSKALAILGGSSSEERSRLAQERVSLLEAERDLLDEIARAPTKEEREELQKELNDLKTMRRELERGTKDERK